MSFISTPNRRKRWYRLLTIGQKKLIVLGSLLGLLVIAISSVLGVYTYRAHQYNLDRVSSGLGVSMLYYAANRPIASISD